MLDTIIVIMLTIIGDAMDNLLNNLKAVCLLMFMLMTFKGDGKLGRYRGDNRPADFFVNRIKFFCGRTIAKT